MENKKNICRPIVYVAREEVPRFSLRIFGGRSAAGQSPSFIEKQKRTSPGQPLTSLRASFKASLRASMQRSRFLIGNTGQEAASCVNENIYGEDRITMCKQEILVLWSSSWSSLRSSLLSVGKCIFLRSKIDIL